MCYHLPVNGIRVKGGTELGKSILTAALLAACLAAPAAAENRSLETGAFAVQHEVVLPGTPEVIFDAISGDISGWWDHSFSGKPLKFYIEPRPGGGFFGERRR